MGAMEGIAENVHGEYMEVDRAKKKWLESKGPIKFPEGKTSWDDLTDDEKETLVQNKSAEINGKPKRDQHTTRDSVWERLKGNVSDFADQLGGTFGDHSGWIDPKTGQFVDRTCFVAGTKVHTKDGLKNIEDIQVGDVVLSKSDETGEISYRKVVETFIRQTEAIYTVSFTDGTTLETTWNHPFRVKKQGHALEKFSIENTAWVQAKDLHPGDVALGADGQELVVTDIVIDERVETVYNFEVEEYHTYFVGEVGVWVHNDSYGGGGSGGSGTGAIYTLKESGGGIDQLPKSVHENFKQLIQAYGTFPEDKQSNKKETEIDGKPQKTKTPGHAETIAEHTLKLRDSGEYSKIYLNKGINRVLGIPKFISPNRLPDIVGVRKDGRIDLFEVPSETDKIPNLEDRMKEVLDKLPENKRGSQKIIYIDKEKYPKDKK